MTTKSQWLDNSKAQERVKELLEEAGVPLELRAWAQAERFRRKFEKDDLHIRTERVVYAATEDEPLRELDFCTTLYQELEISSTLGIQLILNVLIECKYRRDIETFGFPRPKALERPPAYLTFTDLAGSDLALRLRNTPPKDLAANILGVGLIEIEQGKTPKKASDEQLVYKAGAAIYDYITSGLAMPEGEGRTISNPVVQDLLDEFVSYLNSKRYAWWSVLHRWKRESIAAAQIEAFNRRMFGEGRAVYHSITAYLPVVCQNSPLYSVSVTPTAKPRRFRVTHFMVTGIRVPNWPAAAKGDTIDVTPEVPVVVTNVGGLFHVLEAAANWFMALRGVLEGAPATDKERALLEGAFYQAVRHHFGAETSHYRSDFDIEVFL